MAGNENTLFGNCIAVNMDIGNMLGAAYGIRQAGYIDGRIEFDVHDILLQLCLDGIIHLRLRYGAVIEHRQPRYQYISLGGDDLDACPREFQFVDVCGNGDKFFGWNGLQVPLGTSGDFQNQFIVQIAVVRTLGIGNLRNDPFGLVHLGIAEGQSVLADNKLVSLLVLQQGIGVIVGSTINPFVDCLGDIHGKNV